MWQVHCQSIFDKEKYDVRVMLPKYMCMKEDMEGKDGICDAFLYGSWKCDGLQYVGVSED